MGIGVICYLVIEIHFPLSTYDWFYSSVIRKKDIVVTDLWCLCACEFCNQIIIQINLASMYICPLSRSTCIECMQFVLTISRHFKIPFPNSILR
jgi:hypothetical protein